MLDPATDEARTLLHALAAATAHNRWRDLEPAAAARIVDGSGRSRWESRLAGAAAVLAEVSAQHGKAVEVDPGHLLNQRAARRELRSVGTVSTGGGCRLLPSRDGWVAMSLNRASDWELVPALFRTEMLRWDWDGLAAAVARTRGAELESAAIELGLAVAALPANPPPVEQPWRITMTTGDAGPRAGWGRVINLSALWAGPLCASLLRRAGADVTTVESSARPDGARRGDPELYRALHDGDAFVTIDFSDSAGIAELHRLVDGADIVVSASRVRALQQLGLDPFAAVDRRPGLTWVGISAYGLTGAGSNRVGYGDDAAVAAGLVIRGSAPAFFADAAADPITGLYAAIAAFAVSATGGGVIDVSLRDAAAWVAREPT